MDRECTAEQQLAARHHGCNAMQSSSILPTCTPVLLSAWTHNWTVARQPCHTHAGSCRPSSRRPPAHYVPTEGEGEGEGEGDGASERSLTASQHQPACPVGCQRLPPAQVTVAPRLLAAIRFGAFASWAGQQLNCFQTCHLSRSAGSLGSGHLSAVVRRGLQGPGLVASNGQLSLSIGRIG